MLSRLRNVCTGYIADMRAYYKSSWQPIAASNLKMLRLVSVLVVGIIFSFLCAAWFTGKSQAVLIGYLVGLAVHTAFAVLLHLHAERLRWRTRVIQGLCQLFVLSLMALVIYIAAIACRHEPGVFFAPMAIVLSMIFIMPFWQNVTIITGVTAIFMVLSAQLKEPSAFALDASMAVLTWVLCLTTDLVVLDLRLRDFHQRSELMRLSCTDSLTGLMNKNTAEATARAYLAQNGAKAASALLVIDLDQFKQINDHMGHQAGDEALEVFGDSLLKLFRAQDIVGRVGGDEFVALMKNTGDIKLVARRAALICETVRRTRLQAPNLALTCSIGVALCPEHGTTYDALFAKADEQLYRIKREGKNGYRIAK